MKNKLVKFLKIVVILYGVYLLMFIINEIQLYNREKNTVVIPINGMEDSTYEEYSDIPKEVMDKLLEGVMEGYSSEEDAGKEES